MMGWPLRSDCATFSPMARQQVTVTNSVEPSTQVFDSRSKRRGVDATRKLATKCPLLVRRSFGVSTTLPAIVICTSFMAFLSMQSGLSGWAKGNAVEPILGLAETRIVDGEGVVDSNSRLCRVD